MIVFALFEWIPEDKRPTFTAHWLPLGGALSGFFGGLSGHQGAFRSAFFIRTTMTKNQMLATGIIVACCIDVMRLAMYPIQWKMLYLDTTSTYLWTSLISAIMGSFIGQRYLKKITLPVLKNFTAVGLILLGTLMILGKI